MKLKLGLDLHGVIDKEPLLFSIISGLFIRQGHEVHVITGESISDKLVKTLELLRISYTHLFSISSFHKSIGTKILHDKNGRPWMNPEIWNVTKAWYCNKHRINLHIDDTIIYGQYFKTPFLLFK